MNTKKNICLISNSLGEGGIERVVISLATELSAQGHHIDVVLFENKMDYPTSDANFNIHIIQHKKKLKQTINQLNIQFDLIISNDNHEICRQANLPNLYFCIHGPKSAKIIMKYQKNNMWIKRFLGKVKHTLRMIKYVSSIRKTYNNQNLITVSKGAEQNLLQAGIKPKTVQTIYNPFNFNNIYQQAKAYTPNEQDYVIHVGRFDGAQKRHDILIQAYQKSGIDEKLLLLGNDDTPQGEKARQMVCELGLQKKVIFKGFNSNPYPYIKNAKALLLSSDFEGLPTVLIEALILGVPVVSTDCVAGPNEILIDDLNEFLSPVGDVSALALNIKKMLKNPIKITDKYFDRFSAKKSAEQYLALCKND